MQERLAQLQEMRDERVAKVEAVIEASKSDEQALRVANAQLDSLERTRKALAERREADNLAVRKVATTLAQQVSKYAHRKM